MARKRRWSRYRPPVERRTEAGDPVRPAKPPAQVPPKAPRKPKPVSASARPGAGRPLVVLAVVVAVVVGIVLAVRAGGDDDRASGVETELLDETFIREGLADAARAVPGGSPVAVRLNEYSLTVEYYDPNADETRYVERNSYSKGYTIRVEENFYSDYKPVPFALSEADPARMVAAARQALDRTEEAYTWEVRIRVEQGESTPRMVARAGGRDSVEITSAP